MLTGTMVLALFLPGASSFVPACSPIRACSWYQRRAATQEVHRGLRLRASAAPVEKAFEISRIDIRDISPPDFHRLFDTDVATPTIVTNVFSKEVCEKWCEDFVEQLGEETIDFQIRTSETGLSEHLEGTLNDFIEGCFESSHDRSWFLFDEELLTKAPSLSKQLSLPTDYFGSDLFRHFPSPVRPMGSCVVMGGEGSRSTLHADPYEWFGWNLCLEGSKLWTFGRPGKGVSAAEGGGLDDEIEAYRLEPNAWDGFSLSAGWQSDVDLYRHKDQAREWFSAYELGTMGEEQRDAALERVPKAASRAFRSSKELSPDRVASNLASVVQREGELLLIPPRWWHQTLHLEPTVAIASQYTNSRHVDRVYRHMLSWSYHGVQDEVESVMEEVDQARDDGASERACVRLVIQRCLQGKLGMEKGADAFERLLDEEMLLH